MRHSGNEMESFNADTYSGHFKIETIDNLILIMTLILITDTDY
jgi:hypothetical protein